MSRFIGLQPEPSDIAASGIWDIGDVADYESVEATGVNRWPTNESYVHIAKANAASGALSLVFNNIPQGFDDLLLVGSATFVPRAGFNQDGDLFLEVNYTSSAPRDSRYLYWNITSSGYTASKVNLSDGSVKLSATPIDKSDPYVFLSILLTNYTSTSTVGVRAEIYCDANPQFSYHLAGSIDTGGQPVTNLQLYSDYLAFYEYAWFRNEINVYGLRKVYS